MCGGDQVDFDRAQPVIDAYAKAVTLLGGPGSGQRTKMVNQICIAGLVQGLAEGIDFARRAGLDVEQVVATISQGAAGSWQMANRGVTMARREFDFGFALDWMRKDLAICFAEAERIGATLPLTAVIDQYYARLQRQGRRPLGHQLAHRAPTRRLTRRANPGSARPLCVRAALREGRSPRGPTRQAA